MAGSVSPSTTHRPRLVIRRATQGDRCRCGGQIPPGADCLEIVDAPYGVADWIDGRSFCSPGCAREYLVEAIEPLESAVGGAETIAILRSILLAVTVDPGEGPDRRAPFANRST
jgi:hypothetical protein